MYEIEYMKYKKNNNQPQLEYATEIRTIYIFLYTENR